MDFDSISLIMFSFVFIAGIIFSILGLTNLVIAIEKKKTPWLGFIGSVLAAIIWMSFTLVWVAGATIEMFVGFGYLWLALMLTYIMFAVASLGFILHNSVKPEDEPALQIKERT